VTRRILVVDDEPVLRKTLDRALRSMGYDVLAVGDPLLAYELLDGGEFDLVLLDVNMPQMSGDALFVALARRSPAIAGRVILMSGDPGAVGVEWPADLARCPLLGKPFTLELLACSVAAALAAADQASPRRKRNGG
jgi:two-component system response regulator AtoC